MENQEEVANCEPGEDHADGLVYKFDHEHQLSQETVVAPEQLVEVGNGVDSSEETTVQPSTSLQDQLRHGIRDIGLSSCRFDVLQDPVAVALRDELEAENTIFGEVHVGSEDTSIGTVHLLACKVLFEGSISSLIVLQSDVSVRRERTWQDRNEAEGRFEGLVQDITHLVLEILSSNKRVQQVLPSRPQHSLNLTTGTSTHRLQIERLPEVVDGVFARFRTRIDENTDVRVQDTAKGLEEPPVGVDLLLVLLLEAEEHLHGLLLRAQLDHVLLDRDANLGGVLVDVGRHVLAVDLLLCNAILVHSHTCQNSSRSRVDLGTSVADDAHNDLLPSIFSPCLAVLARAHVLDILEDTAHGTRKQDVILVVHGHHDEQFRVARLGEELLSEGEALLVKLARVTSGCRISHVGELVSLRRRSVRDHVQELGRDRAIEDEVAIEELDFLDRLESPQPSWSGRRRRLDSLVEVLVVGGVGGVWAIWVILLLEDRAVVIVVVEVGGFIVGREVRQGMLFGDGRLVGLLVVCIVVRLRVYVVVLGVVMRRVQRIPLFVRFVVAVGSY